MRLHEEAEIVWLHDRSVFPMVREALMCGGTRSRAPAMPKDGSVLVGYAVLKPRVGSRKSRDMGRRLRRYWYVMPYDFEPHRSGVEMMTRCEGVDPLTVSPGVAGEKTERSATPATASQRRAIRAILKRAQPKPRPKPKGRPKARPAARPATRR